MKLLILSLSLAACSFAFIGCETNNTGGDTEPQRVYSREPISPADRTTQIQSGVDSIQRSTGGNIL
ncbi:MAG: hypothetical protein HRU46_16710 [Verrucomicrobiales bacterium]|nr:hypothetical protein [Verrucomicrobiales bacterium]